jgi:hypothetical protein
LFRLGLSVAGPFVGRCLTSLTVPRFHSPLIKLDGRFSRIQLSDKATHTFAHDTAGASLVEAGAVPTPGTGMRQCSVAYPDPVP